MQYRFFGMIVLSILTFSSLVFADTQSAESSAKVSAKSKVKRTFYWGVCVGEKLSGQGISVFHPGNRTKEELKAAIQGAVQVCKSDAEKAKKESETAPTESSTANPTPAAIDLIVTSSP